MMHVTEVPIREPVEGEAAVGVHFPPRLIRVSYAGLAA
jgi:hypothetical protein